MKLKRIFAGITALAVIGSTSCLPVLAEDLTENTSPDTEMTEEASSENESLSEFPAEAEDNVYGGIEEEPAAVPMTVTETDADGNIVFKEYRDEPTVNYTETELNAPTEIYTAAGNVLIDSVNFPDSNFRSYIQSAFDRNSDGVLTESEIASVTEINVIGKNIYSIKGVEFFPNLKKLYCGNNFITSVDLSKNTDLILLSCYNNNISSLDVSRNVYLKEMSCRDNPIKYLDVSKNKLLTSLWCYKCNLASVDISNLNSLTTFECYDNSYSIGDVYYDFALSQIVGFNSLRAMGWDGAEYDSASNSLKNFSSENGGKVTYTYNCGNGKTAVFNIVYSSYSQYGALEINAANFKDAAFRKYVSDNLDKNKDGKISNSEISSVKEINVSNLGITSLSGIENFTSLTKLTCSGNKLTSLDLSKNTALVSVVCTGNSFSIGDVKDSYSLSKLGNGFDASKASGWNGARYVSSSKTLTDFANVNGGKVTYNYNCGNGITVQLALAYSSYSKSGEVNITQLNFPDSNFRNYVSENFDTDGNGILSKGEIELVKTVNVDGREIANLKGIEFFTALERLSCSNNKLVSLDLSKNTALTTVNCCYNKISSLNVKNNTLLKFLDCYGNQLGTLDLSANTLLMSLDCHDNLLEKLSLVNNKDLTTLYCHNNKLTLLDISGCTALNYLSCNNNELEALDTSANTVLRSLVCYDNKLLSLDLTKNIALRTLNCNNNNLTSLDLRKNTALSDFKCSDNKYDLPDVVDGSFDLTLLPGFEVGRAYDWAGAVYDPSSKSIKNFASKENGVITYTYDCGNNKYAVFTLRYNLFNKAEDVELNEENFPDVNLRKYIEKEFDKDRNGILSVNEIKDITSLNVSSIYAYDAFDENKKYKIDIENLKGIEYFTELRELYCPNNKIKNLDISKNEKLTVLDCSNNLLGSLYVKENTKLTTLNCSGNKINGIDLSKNLLLANLNCYDNQLNDLDISKNTALTVINCSSNRLTSLNVKNNKALVSLSCDSNSLSSLDVTENTALKNLYCYNNLITSLDVSKNKELVSLSCGSNQLTSIDISKNTNLSAGAFTCGGNIFPIGDVADSYSLLQLPGFDIDKASDWYGAKYDKITNVLRDFDKKDGGVIYYNYKCRSDVTVMFTLSYDSYTRTSEVEIEDIKLENFPDKKFRDHVKKYDTDNNGYLTAGELAAVETIDVHGMGIKDLTGIEYFTSLKKLYCYDNELTNLDISKNRALTTLHCYNNDLPRLFVSNNTALTTLHCYNNRIQKLDLSSNSALVTLYCYNNRLTSLDLSNNTVLTNFEGYGNKYELGEVAGYYSLSHFDGFNSERASEWTGADYDIPLNSIFNFENLNGGRITYKYDCGNGHSAVFTLMYDSYTPLAEKPMLTVSAGDKCAVLNWKPIETATEYRVFVYDSLGNCSVACTTTDTSYTVKGLENDKEYGFLVRAFINGAWTPYTDSDIKRAIPREQSNKLNVKAVAGTGAVDLSWNSLGVNVTYRVYSYDDKTHTYTELTNPEEPLSSLNYKAVGLKNGVTYGFFVRAFVDGEWSPFNSKEVVYATPITAPKPIVSAEAGNGYITLTWDFAGNNATYKVYSYNGKGSYTSIKTTTEKTCTITGLQGGKRYGYLVRACINGQWSPYSEADVVYAVPTGTSTSKPVVTATSVIAGVTLSWNSMGDGVTYRVYRYDGNGKYTVLASSLTDTYYTVTGLSDKEYHFLVRANINGKWTPYDYSDNVSARPISSSAAKPTVTATAGSGSVTLKWNDMGKNAVYKVYRYDKASNSYKTIAVDLTDTTYIVSDLVNGKEYGFLVRACINNVWSSYDKNGGDVVYATPTAAPAVKPVLKITAGNSSAVLNWSYAGGKVDYYKIYRYNEATKKYSTVADRIKDTKYTVDGLINGQKYGFMVRACVNGTLSPYTAADVVYVTPANKPSITSAVKADGTVTLKWSSMGSDVTYRVYRYNPESKKYTAVVTEITDTSCTIPDISFNGTHDIKYGYMVRAYINGKWTSYDIGDVVYPD